MKITATHTINSLFFNRVHRVYKFVIGHRKLKKILGYSRVFVQISLISFINIEEGLVP